MGRRWLICWLIAVAAANAADDPVAGAARPWGDGLAAFDRAQAADALGDGARAKRELVAARAALDDAIARYRALIAASPSTLPEAERRLGEACGLGRACCGKVSLWKRYGVAETE